MIIREIKSGVSTMTVRARLQSSSWTGTPYLRQSDDSTPAAVEVVMMEPALLDCLKMISSSLCLHNKIALTLGLEIANVFSSLLFS